MAYWTQSENGRFSRHRTDGDINRRDRAARDGGMRCTSWIGRCRYQLNVSVGCCLLFVMVMWVASKNAHGEGPACQSELEIPAIIATASGRPNMLIPKSACVSRSQRRPLQPLESRDSSEKKSAYLLARAVGIQQPPNSHCATSRINALPRFCQVADWFDACRGVVPRWTAQQLSCIRYISALSC